MNKFKVGEKVGVFKIFEGEIHSYDAEFCAYLVNIEGELVLAYEDDISSVKKEVKYNLGDIIKVDGILCICLGEKSYPVTEDVITDWENVKKDTLIRVYNEKLDNFPKFRYFKEMRGDTIFLYGSGATSLTYEYVIERDKKYCEIVEE